MLVDISFVIAAVLVFVVLFVVFYVAIDWVMTVYQRGKTRL